MSTGMLTQQVEAYYGWKNNLIREITRYSSWLQQNNLHNEDIELRLNRGIQLLQDDTLTIAFVGEYSRGKTELINALFFAGFKQRMLPSQAGRTTMCPTELFFDHHTEENYLKLLPIDTRNSDKSLAELKLDDRAWKTIPLPVHSPQQMQATLAEVANTLTVTLEEARALGFSDDLLDPAPNQANRFFVPAWRHAMISLRHPLLEQGLRILDTPGLNALGSEPELTISMLPNAHAVLFLLSADTGVTASDMSIWQDFITTDHADHRAGRFAVLNKIDVLWDDIQGDAYTEQSVEKVRRYTADKLGLPAEAVIPVSAKQGLIAKVKDDNHLLDRSLLPELESLISERILVQKEQLITQTLVNDILGMLQNSQAVMTSRLDSLNEQYHQYLNKGVNPQLLQQLTEKTQQDYDFYYKKLITLRSSRRLMKSQQDILTKLISFERLDAHVMETQLSLQESLTTLQMNRAMTNFFKRIDNDINNLMSEANLAQKMVQSIYKRYTQDTRAKHLMPPRFTVTRQLTALNNLEDKAARFRRNPKTVFTGQTQLIKRFTSTLVSEAKEIHKAIFDIANRWPDEALLPIMQYTVEQKQLLEHQIKRLKTLTKTDRDARSHKEKLQEMIQETQKQLMVAENIQRHVRKPAPTQLKQKVVNLRGWAS